MVRARGREWVVLPGDDPAMLLLRPLGGTDEDACGLSLALEGDDVASAGLPLPAAAAAGNGVAAALLRDAVRLGFRSAAGPLRSLARIAVEPRPYQLVPLLMALRQEPVRLLIGDDVGVGKTIEAAMIARELLDRGEIRRLCVLCPPHLCEQWCLELEQKFHLPARAVRPGTVTALERDLPADRSLFDEYPCTVVSIDFIKSDHRRARFLQTCPELVIVDEAHTAAQTGTAARGQQQRHSLLAALAADPQRHLVLVTATPHSGDAGAFASLVALLRPDLAERVAAGDYAAGSSAREQLARHFVQRRRADVDDFLQAHTVFPRRETLERSYKLTPAYRRLLDDTRNYTRELVQSSAGASQFAQRVRWWAALALLRCVGSSPAAAVAALRTRAALADSLSVEEADRLGQVAVFDLLHSDEAEGDDGTPGADVAEEGSADRRRLLALARQAEALSGADDPKLAEAERLLRTLLHDGFAPILFCRYVATAHYVAEELGRRLPGVRFQAVTGELPAEERTARVADLATAPKRVLVATDCLSEGINLQQHFDAVVHYDLAWNPTRHEQREGRADRYGQPSPVVRTALLYGEDNPVDGAVLRVLLRKAEQIRRVLGVSVPVPVENTAVLNAIFEELFGKSGVSPQQLSLFLAEEEERVDAAWQAAGERERRSRTVFAQQSLKPEEVLPELEAVGAAVGTADDVRRFVLDACARLDAPMQPEPDGRSWRLAVAQLPAPVRSRADLTDSEATLRLSFELPAPDGATYLPRSHPLVEALAGYVLDTAIDTPQAAVASRLAAIRTRAVSLRTVLLLLRLRFLIEERKGERLFPMLAEECLLTGFRGDPRAPDWLDSAEAERLAGAVPAANVLPGQAQHWLQQVLAAQESFAPALSALARRRADELLAAHRRVRAAAHLRIAGYSITAHPELDLLGLYVLMPAGGAP
jgi:superfamily II DNA or RNA helicase